MNGLERAGGFEVRGADQQFGEARFDLLHGGDEHDAAAIDEDDVGEDVLNFFDLVRGDDNRAVAIEVVVEQRIVELLAVEDVEAERGLVEDEQPGVDGHDDGEVKLRDHALGEFADFAGGTDGSPGEKAFCLGAIEARMNSGDVIERVRDADPARKHSDVGDE